MSRLHAQIDLRRPYYSTSEGDGDEEGDFENDFDEGEYALETHSSRRSKGDGDMMVDDEEVRGIYSVTGPLRQMMSVLTVVGPVVRLI